MRWISGGSSFISFFFINEPKWNLQIPDAPVYKRNGSSHNECVDYYEY